MKFGSVSILTLAMASATLTSAHASNSSSTSSPQEQANVAPALAAYTENVLQEEVWERDGLSVRDRSIVTLATLVARNDAAELTYHFNLALDNGVEPGEITELITHLAFYSGWGNATSATELLAPVFEERGISSDDVPGEEVELLPLDEEAEAERATFVESEFGDTAPGVVHYTTEALFRDLWLRPGLEPRDRSLVTVSALIANGNVEQVPFHLNRAMDNGLTQEEASEMLTQLAFYAGWPNVFSALPIARDVFESRGE
ncbi:MULTISPECIES: carboxymuconolactone decarboxylase family protein [unclassified Halomonas]|uniref:carboxymuconolactone decarboxylase family protein n=1 Tax=unclassified Halomonas TaxID=2609666 RepID=UPI00207681A5|nr:MULTISPECIES: carboxymuconolactone decarboxylase family protein [unclassified Halomonas]